MEIVVLGIFANIDCYEFKFVDQRKESISNLEDNGMSYIFGNKTTF